MRCPRCDSRERRPGGKGCAECNRRRARVQYATRARPPDDDSDIVISPAMRVYLAAFDAFLAAWTRGEARQVRASNIVKAAALDEMLSKRQERR